MKIANYQGSRERFGGKSKIIFVILHGNSLTLAKCFKGHNSYNNASFSFNLLRVSLTSEMHQAVTLRKEGVWGV